ncbi:HNH endonuclease signature motif containing protein [Mariniluteicoccus endophyticus]
MSAAAAPAPTLPSAVTASTELLLTALSSIHDHVRTPDLGLLTDAQLLELAQRVGVLATVVEAAQRLVVAAVETRDAAGREHGVTTTAWLREQRGHTHAQARAVVRGAVETTGQPAVWWAMASGQVAPRQADAITKALRLLPADLSTSQQQQAEATMIDYAAEFDPRELQVLGNRLVEVVDPDHADELLEQRLDRQQRAARNARELHLIPDGNGGVKVRGLLPLTEGEQLACLLDAVGERHRALASVPPGQDSLPSCGDPGCGDGRPEAACAACRAWFDHLMPQCGPSCPGVGCGLCGGRASRARARADALVEIAQAYADACRTPALAADRPRINLTVPMAVLTGRDRPVELAGESLSSTEVRRLACDADLVTMVVDALGNPVHVARQKRLFTDEIRAALIARDGGCVFPGCERPPRATHGHHIVPWVAGGPTTLDNGVLLCPHHHALVEPDPHRPDNPDRWEVRIGDSGLPEFLPPRALDPVRRPRLHLRHRLRLSRNGDGDSGSESDQPRCA